MRCTTCGRHAGMLDGEGRCFDCVWAPRARGPGLGCIALLTLLGLYLLFGVVLRTGAQDTPEQTLAHALRRVVSADGRWPASHCRNAGLPIPGGDVWARCDRRLRTFAQLFVREGRRHHVDPYLLAAMASRESGLDPWARGAVGEIGVLQLHPRGRGARLVRLLSLPGARERCERRADACQGPVVARAAAYVRSAITRCGGVAEGLGAYNRGRCGETSYSRRVLERRLDLLQWSLDDGATIDIRPEVW